MMSYKRMVVLLCLATPAVWFVAPAITAPEPNEAPVDWEIDIRYETPRAILVDVPGEAPPRRYWYFLYTVTNRSGEDHQFVPEIALYTNTGELVPSGKDVHPLVFQTIKSQRNNPLLRDTVGITGKLLQGEDNAKTGVAIFRDFDPAAASFTIFFGGLSGETAVIHLPEPIRLPDPLEEGKTIETSKVTLSKTLALTYNVGAEAQSRTRADLRLVRKTWVMR
ncbi:MAG: hypothetical protein JXA11_01865 [Phycisphaerae bacterium]|nr:hypothetical protein [Phycisphaerae bacterium]